MAERHVTYTGRVVYERKKHLFAQSDLDRILRGITEDKPPEFLSMLLHSLDDYMLGLILAPLGQADKARLVREWLEYAVGKALSFLGGYLKIRVEYITPEKTDRIDFV